MPVRECWSISVVRADENISGVVRRKILVIVHLVGDIFRQKLRDNQVSSALAFTVPDISPEGKLAYAYATYIFLSFMYTVVNIPLASILPAMTDDMNERTVLATWRKFLAFLGATIVSATALSMV